MTCWLTLVSCPAVITSSSTRDYVVSQSGVTSETKTYQWRQSITFQSCAHDETSSTSLPSQMLRVEQIFVMYDVPNQLIRYAMTNKIGDVNGEVTQPLLSLRLPVSTLV